MTVQEIKTCFAVGSKTEDGLHILMLDFDINHNDFNKLIEDLSITIKNFGLSDMYVIESTNGYNIYTLDKMYINVIKEIGESIKCTDADFIKFGKRRGYYDLRMDGNDKKLVTVVDGTFNPMYKRSNAHRLFFNIIYHLNIKKNNYFDNYTKFELIEYESKKHGYFIEKIEGN